MQDFRSIPINQEEPKGLRDFSTTLEMTIQSESPNMTTLNINETLVVDNDIHSSTPHPRRRKTDWFPSSNSQRNITVSVIIPALNEEENLPHVLPKIPSWVHEIILVDGHSKDNTVSVALALRPDIRVIQQEGRGKGAAIRTGFASATGEIIIMLDADGSTDPIEISQFCALLATADFVKGSRFLQGANTHDMPLHRKIGNGAFVKLTNLLFGTRFTDITYGYNATWRKNSQYLALDIDGWANEIITNIRVARSGLRVVEIPCVEHQRIAGQAKLSTWSAGWTILKAICSEAVLHHFGSQKKRVK